MWNHIVLEPEQKQLLAMMVEAQRSLPRARRQEFIYGRHMTGGDLAHPGLATGDRRNVYEGDLEALAEAGLLRRVPMGPHSWRYDVRPQGFQYYEALKAEEGEPVERVETEVRSFLESDRFARSYPEAYAKWRDAEDLLWSSDSPAQLSKIGHSCREAMIAFTNALVERLAPPDVERNPANTVTRLRAVLSHRADRLGHTERPFLDALVTYWGCVHDLVQRQEHAALRERDELVWEDGRRVVFQTAIVMYEVDRTLAG